MSTLTLPKRPTKSWKPSLKDKAAAELELRRRRKQREGLNGQTSPLLWYFVQSTTGHTLDAWQIKLCFRLQKTASQTGQRILIHAPPQIGKSVIVSQRFPAWLLAIKPNTRVKLACYNVTHAANFGGVVRDLMQEDSFKKLFPDTDGQFTIPATASKEAFFTAARAKYRDAQPSFKALGLQTGFVGQGSDTLILDDPYASPQEAYSPVIRGNVWTFWSASAKVRLTPESNVIVMFHRYVEQDLAGSMWEERSADGSRVWEMWRFAMEADGDPEMPDPMGRAIGEKLSSRISDVWIAEQKKNPLVWSGQFQGKPVPLSGLFFDTAWFKIASIAPATMKQYVRYWDIAGAAPGKGDWTVGCLMAEDLHGHFWILDVKRFQKEADERDATILQTAELDRQKYPTVKTYIEQPPGLGKEAVDTLIVKLKGYTVEADRVTKDKVTRAEPYKGYARAGNIHMVSNSGWNDEFLAVHTVFPLGDHDDDVDAASGAFNKLTLVEEEKPLTVSVVDTRGSRSAGGAAAGGFSARTTYPGIRR